MDDTLKNDLMELGCPTKLIEELRHTNDRAHQLTILNRYRKDLLECVHSEQRKLQCLDYLIFQMKQEK